jgi:His/Glu/Gln/Arg/opine family amino acid ABC transporter permease subunit
MLLTSDNILYIVKGIFVTLKYTLLSVSLGLGIAIILSLFRMSSYKALQKFVKVYVSLFRGTPLLIQLSLVYLALPSLTGYKISAFAAGVIAFSLNSGAYISEVIRTGINSIDKGQFEAAKTLGIPHTLMMRDIIFPQALRNSLPSLVNEIIDLLKESALVSTIGEADLMRRAQTVAAEKYIYFEPLIVAAICYYIMVMFFSHLAKLLENRLKNDSN